jgi:hypothetical protein
MGRCTRQNARQFLAPYPPTFFSILHISQSFSKIRKGAEMRHKHQHSREGNSCKISIYLDHTVPYKKRHYPSSISKGIISKQTTLLSSFPATRGKRKYYIPLSKSTSRRLRNLPNIHFPRLFTAILPLHLPIRLRPSKRNHSRGAPNRQVRFLHWSPTRGCRIGW